jgi:hypothetical protein
VSSRELLRPARAAVEWAAAQREGEVVPGPQVEAVRAEEAPAGRGEPAEGEARAGQEVRAVAVARAVPPS